METKHKFLASCLCLLFLFPQPSHHLFYSVLFWNWYKTYKKKAQRNLQPLLKFIVSHENVFFLFGLLLLKITVMIFSHVTSHNVIVFTAIYDHATNLPVKIMLVQTSGASLLHTFLGKPLGVEFLNQIITNIHL